MLDGNARLSLATFVGTWMEEPARRLYAETVDKNLIDKDEYPRTAEIEQRCWRILAGVWNALDVERALGMSTIGSSEACMLGGLALKKRWQARRGDPSARPNLVMSSAVQVCWEKFCAYWDVEPRYVPVTDEHPVLDGDGLDELVDEDTIGVVGILGVTYTGAYEPIAGIAKALDRIQEERGLDIPIHVDAASGGFVAPFTEPELEWDFRVERVASINASAHKYGLVYPGLGWIVRRDEALVPEEMIFHVAYLGGDLPNLGLNFTRPGAQVLFQYYMLLRLGRRGFEELQTATRGTAQWIADRIGEMPEYRLVQERVDLPVIAWAMDDPDAEWTLSDVSDRLRMSGWIVPAYPMPEDLADRWVLRVVVRHGFGRGLAADFVADLRRVTSELASGMLPGGRRGESGFHH
ncbi:Glutamate decarboxylase [Pseudoclavibacter triregionum]|nr:Glutamate decarboxylase [Pseudoclavibacter triregionum]